jgi:DNA-binding HxlR family transcriptional regulator
MNPIPSNHWDVYNPNCPSRVTLDLIARRWTVLLVGMLASGPKRFGELERGLGGISAKVLAQVLRELARNGLVTRTLYPEVPPRTVYALTDMGETLVVPLAALRDWAEDNIEAIYRVRVALDEEGRSAAEG